MGLAAPKRRNRISDDPNNTFWSRSTSRYGYRILESQGWNPGDHLGARDAPHSSHYGAASSEHIRVVLKDGNAGLGAGLRKEKTETYGLSGFQGILGRLNGKSVTEVKKEEATRRDVQLRLYTGQRYGFLNFVSGGFLVGDTIKRDNPSERDAQPSMWLDSIEEPHKLLPKSSKRKRAAEGENNAAGFKIHAKRLKKATDHGSDEEMEKAPEAFDEGDIPQEPEVRSKKTKMRAERRALNDARRAKKEEREQRKAGKEARKEERRQRREERRQRRLTKQGKERNETGQEEAEPEPNPVSADATSAQVLSSRASPYGRQALRKRYIQQKKMASLDTQALKEIFMGKT